MSKAQDAISALAHSRGSLSPALDLWADLNGVTLHFSRPGNPNDNAFIESFTGSFRDECLNVHWFLSLADARSKCEAWRADYNHVRPYRWVGKLPPALYAKKLA